MNSETVIGLFNEEDQSIIYTNVDGQGDIHSYGAWLREAYNTAEIVLALLKRYGTFCPSIKKYINNALTNGIKNIYLFVKGDWSIYDIEKKQFCRFDNL